MPLAAVKVGKSTALTVGAKQEPRQRQCNKYSLPFALPRATTQWSRRCQQTTIQGNSLADHVLAVVDCCPVLWWLSSEAVYL